MNIIKLCLTSMLILMATGTPFSRADDTIVLRPDTEFLLVGDYDFDYLIWDVYIVRLYSEDGIYLESVTKPYVLEIVYERPFSRNNLVDETRKQLKLIGETDEQKVEYWLDKLNNILVNVSAGDTISLFVDENHHSQLFHNDTLLGKIEDQEFTRMFSGIWLSEKSSRPRMRNSLLNKG